MYCRIGVDELRTIDDTVCMTLTDSDENNSNGRRRKMIKTRRENSSGLFFWTRHNVTRIYQVIEQRQCGSSKITYLLSTGSDLKASFSEFSDAVAEAKRRQAWIDAR